MHMEQRRQGGDAPTTSEWSTMLFPTKLHLLEVDFIHIHQDCYFDVGAIIHTITPVPVK